MVKPLSITDNLEELWAEKSLECNSRAQHDCTIEALYATFSRCNGQTRYWCAGRHALWLKIEGDYTVVCRDCGIPTFKCWIVRPI